MSSHSEKVVEEQHSLDAHDSKESHNGDKVLIDPEAERKLLRKLDWTLLPLFTLICERGF
jgi:hypothetical protein